MDVTHEYDVLQKRREQFLTILAFVGALLLQILESNAPGNGFNQDMIYSGATANPGVGVVCQTFSEMGFYLAFASIFNCISEHVFAIAYERLSSVIIPSFLFVLSMLCNTIAFVVMDYAYWFKEFKLYNDVTDSHRGFWSGEWVQITWLVYFVLWSIRFCWALVVVAIKDHRVNSTFKNERVRG